MADRQVPSGAMMVGRRLETVATMADRFLVLNGGTAMR
jgi:hypothetical protein